VRASRAVDTALLCAGVLLAVVACTQVARAETVAEEPDAAAELDPFDAELDAAAIPDPIEPVNRGIFAGNRVVDRVVLDPVTRLYGKVVPDPVKRGVRNVFDNLNQPVVIANDLLQLRLRRAGSATARFVLNSTFGIAGIFDPAREAGLQPHRADFGQTLGRYGVGPGIYLVLPLLGPSSARDAVGTLVDLALRPETWLLPIPPRVLLGGTWGISEREQHIEALDALEGSSVDFYATIRTAYWMDREAFVREAREREEPRPEPEGEPGPEGGRTPGPDVARAAGTGGR
jgi:phospholipid-binding lipoprotein MlaA